MNEEQGLSDAEKELFKGLEREQKPPKALEHKIIAQLINEGQLKKTSAMNIYMKWVSSIAAATLIFLSGAYYEKTRSVNPVIIEPSRGFMLLLHEDHNFKSGDPKDMVEEYRRWRENTMTGGVKIVGQELKNESSIINAGKKVAHRSDRTSRTTGYFLLEARSMDEAILVAKENPHIKYGGTIEVKAFMVR